MKEYIDTDRYPQPQTYEALKTYTIKMLLNSQYGLYRDPVEAVRWKEELRSITKYCEVKNG